MSRGRSSRLGVLALGLAAAVGTASDAAAQSTSRRKPSVASLERLLVEKRDELLRRENDIEQLTDLMVRYHLGIDGNLREFTALTEAERSRSVADVEHSLAGSLDAAARANGELERMRSKLGNLHESMAKAQTREQQGQDWSAPVLGASPPGGVAPAAANTGIEMPPPETPEVPLAAGGGEDGTTVDPGDVLANPDEAPHRTPPALIHGTIDHAHLGRAFFMAGHHEKALAELEKVTGDDADETVDLLNLFYLARTHEKLDDLARADSTFLRIEALDEKRAGENAGRWAAAARTARQHMNWMRDHGAWHPPKLTPGK